MEGNVFDLIIQIALEQKHLMEHLVEENRLLHCQLTALQEARGIFVEIDGRRFQPQALPCQSTLSGNPPTLSSPYPPSETRATAPDSGASPTREIDLAELEQGQEEEEGESGLLPQNQTTILKDALISPQQKLCNTGSVAMERHCFPLLPQLCHMS